MTGLSSAGLGQIATPGSQERLAGTCSGPREQLEEGERRNLGQRGNLGGGQNPKILLEPGIFAGFRLLG